MEDLELETTLETPVQEEPSRRMRRSATDRTIHSVSKRDEILVKDDKAPPELRLVSQPQSQPDLDLDKLQNYVYDDKGGQGVTVYVIDSGVNLNHPVSCFQHLWLILLTDNTIGVLYNARYQTLALSWRN